MNLGLQPRDVEGHKLNVATAFGLDFLPPELKFSPFHLFFST